MRIFYCLLSLTILGLAVPAAPTQAQPLQGGALAHPPMYYERSLVNPPEGSGLLHANTFAGDALERMLNGRVNKGAAILVASMTNLNDLNQTSAFGRLAMHQVGSRLGQYGYRILDVNLRQDMLVNNQGEFMLSRDISKLAQTDYGAEAALVGTYSVAGNNVYCSVRVLRLEDSAVVAAYEYWLPRSGDTARLLPLAASGGYYGRQPAFSSPPPLPPMQQR